MTVFASQCQSVWLVSFGGFSLSDSGFQADGGTIAEILSRFHLARLSWRVFLEKEEAPAHKLPVPRSVQNLHFSTHSGFPESRGCLNCRVEGAVGLKERRS